MAYFLGIDGGTESIRAILFDPEGRPKGSHASAYQTQFPKPSWAEQDPQDWWRCLGEAVRGAVAAAGATTDQIIALCVDTTCCSVVAVDADGAPLRPAMIWMDVRSAGEAADVAAGGDPALRINSDGRGPVSAEWMIPKSLWMKRYQPELFQRAARVCEYQDYINWRLTGRWVASLNNMAVRWHYQSREGGLPSSLLAKLGIAELAQKWPPTIVRPGDVIDSLSRSAAEHLGLKAGIPVVQGGADAFIGVIGLGVTEPGEMAAGRDDVWPVELRLEDHRERVDVREEEIADADQRDPQMQRIETRPNDAFGLTAHQDAPHRLDDRRVEA